MSGKWQYARRAIFVVVLCGCVDCWAEPEPGRLSDGELIDQLASQDYGEAIRAKNELRKRKKAAFNSLLKRLNDTTELQSQAFGQPVVETPDGSLQLGKHTVGYAVFVTLGRQIEPVAPRAFPVALTQENLEVLSKVVFLIE